jgi:hypothetical protein
VEPVGRCAGPESGFTSSLRSRTKPCPGLVPAFARRAVQLDASSKTKPEEVSTMAKKDDGHSEIKKGKESER